MASSKKSYELNCWISLQFDANLFRSIMKFFAQVQYHSYLVYNSQVLYELTFPLTRLKCPNRFKVFLAWGVGATTFSITTFSITTLSIPKLSIKNSAY
jgi:hypothetical protein